MSEKTLPDCMIPDGAPICEGYKQLMQKLYIATKALEKISEDKYEHNPWTYVESHAAILAKETLRIISDK